MAQALTTLSTKPTINRVSFAVHTSLLAGFVGLVGFVASVCSHVH